MGSAQGAEKVAAKRTGLELDEYRLRVSLDEKWCTNCKQWHKRDAFGIDRSRGDGLFASCVKSREPAHPPGWMPQPKINLMTGKPGPAPEPPRDGDKIQARASVNRQVRYGNRPNPNALPCTDCGHIGTDRRHEYDHHLGYAAENHFNVQAVCTKCHHKREALRG